MTDLTYFTSESVSEGHPDKMADQISDAILDALITDDKHTRAGIETMVKTGLVLVSGEVRTNTWVDIEDIIRQVVLDIGYDHSSLGFDGNTCAVLNGIGKQSQDIAQGVDETESLMPAPIHYSHNLVRRQAEVRKNGDLPYLRPDAKSQVTFAYDGDTIVGIDAVVLSTQHDEDVSLEQLQREVKEHIIAPVLPEAWLNDQTKYHINPTGRFVIGGPVGDAGLTGRKIIVDTYGGMARHGGGAFSGKDPSKVDRSAAYAARYVAKNLVAAGLADRCEVQVSYAIGVAEPTSIRVETFGTSNYTNAQLDQLVRAHFDLRPRAISTMLDLNRPIYRPTAAYGHFGRDDLDLTWERTDRAQALAEAAAKL